MATPAARPADDVDIPPDLHFTADDTPGIRRRRAGTGFTYRRADGTTVSDPATLARIRALAVPPAWTDVWICPDPDGHLQATGRDAKGRKQYRYHARFRAHRELTKFERLYEFGNALPALRRKVAGDLALHGIPKDKVVAAVVRLLEATLVRVGNEEYARANGSFGLTTLRDRHASFTSDGFELRFRGKHGIAASVVVRDRRLRSIVKRCQDLPGQVLFQYVGNDGEQHPITSTDVNDYMRATTGLDATAKDVRTWTATMLAASALGTLPPPRNATAGRRMVRAVCEAVGAQLRNTPAVCRASYIHPYVVDEYLAGRLATRWENASARGSRWLSTDERKLLSLLKSARAGHARHARRVAA